MMKEGKKVHLVSVSLQTQGFLNKCPCCLPWIQFLVDKLYRHCRYTQNRSVERYLPYDILINIFSRLPAECVLHSVHCGETCKQLRLLTTTPSFVNLHFRRANPIIAFYYYETEDDKRSRQRGKIAEVNFTDEMAKSITTKPTWFKQYSDPEPYCCLNGFLLFLESRGSRYHIWNPVTGQKKTFYEPYYNENFNVCGFYCHLPTMEYRILFVAYKTGQFQFCIQELLSERKRRITNFTHPPNRVRSPVFLNGILHWMVCDKSYQYAHSDNPGCSSSIMLFNTTSEEFSTIPHPGDECGLRKKHDMMELMDMEGNLSLCDTRSYRYLDIWMLEDYENRFWVKRYSIEIELLLEFCGKQYKYGSHVNLGGFYMYNKELLLKVSDNDLILYNLQTSTIRRVGKQMRKDLRVVAVPHIDTLFIDIF